MGIIVLLSAVALVVAYIKIVKASEEFKNRRD